MTKPAKLIALPENLQAFAEERVRAGEYANLEEVAEEAFRLLLQRHERRQMLRSELADVLREMDEHADEPATDDIEREAPESHHSNE